MFLVIKRKPYNLCWNFRSLRVWGAAASCPRSEGRISFFCFFWQNIKYLNSSTVRDVFFGHRYKSQAKDSLLATVMSFKLCCLHCRPRLSWWTSLRWGTSHAFFLPIPAKTLVESQPVSVWKGRRAWHISRSPNAWDTSWTGIKRSRYLTPVLNHNSSQMSYAESKHVRIWRLDDNSAAWASISSVLHMQK